MSMYFFVFLSYLVVTTNVVQVSTGFSDYLSSIKHYFISDDSVVANHDAFVRRIPYEVSTTDEKFITEAAKLTGVALSELDSCQQRVVLTLKSDCDKLNDEQLAKIGVHLLNCQSYVEGRDIYPCTADMAIRDCTKNMDSDTWTSYHLMTNRAKAVCYSIRQLQFRGLAEHTVNRLMDTARHQLQTLDEIAETQQTMQAVAENTLTTLTQGHMLLSSQQKDIQKAQFHGQLALEDNLRKLSYEKELISETNNELILMSNQIHEKIEDYRTDLVKQSQEAKSNHKELLDDILQIQERAKMIFGKIEDSSKHLLEQNANFKMQYEETLRNLAEVNRTVHGLVHLVDGTRQALEERLVWLSTALGGTDLAVERLYLILWHVAFMLISMLTCAFLSARLFNRVVVTILPPINLALSLWDNQNRMEPLTLATTLICLVLGQNLILWSFRLKSAMKGGALKWKNIPEPQQEVHSEAPEEDMDFDRMSINLDTSELDDEFDGNVLGSPTPPLSRSGYYNRSLRSRSKSNTPSTVKADVRTLCQARTRLGTLCKLSSVPGRDFCYKHQGGSSVIG